MWETILECEVNDLGMFEVETLACSAGVLELEIVNSPPSLNSPPYWFGKSGWGGGREK